MRVVRNRRYLLSPVKFHSARRVDTVILLLGQLRNRLRRSVRYAPSWQQGMRSRVCYSAPVKESVVASRQSMFVVQRSSPTPPPPPTSPCRPQKPALRCLITEWPATGICRGILTCPLKSEKETLAIGWQDLLFLYCCPVTRNSLIRACLALH
jgi:hypothetical protein